ncbi:MAG: tetratricopeptide repeat protein, partial [Campylobacterales bacterium]|nr:tetratricopeptide repeat protein [Campylobacterales bacterium]
NMLMALDSNNYKPATANYYLGEIAYYQKKYDLAITHFKKSASLHDKASYMPTLLLHTAISFEKTKNNNSAKQFYDVIISNYPDSDAAKIARKNLQSIK